MISRARANKAASKAASKTGRWLEPAVTSAEKNLRELVDAAARRDADEVALRRVWARLAQVPELVHPASLGAEGGRRRWWPWALSASLLGAGAAMAVMVLLVGAPSKSHRSALVPSGNQAPMAGDTTSARRRDLVGHGLDTRASDARRLDMRDQSVLLAPATVKTRRGQVLPLSLRGGTTIALAGESELSLDESDRPTVTMGEVHFHVPPQSAGHTFVVMARQYRLAVRGTRFVVRVAGANASVQVEDGVVEVWEGAKNQRLARVGEGESWASPVAARSTSGTEGASRRDRPQRALSSASSRDSATASLSARRSSRLHAMASSVSRSVASQDMPAGTRTVKTSGWGSSGGPTLPPTSDAVPHPAALVPAGVTSGANPASGTVAAPAVPAEPAAPVSAASASTPPASSGPASFAVAQPATLDAIALTIQAKTARASGDPERALALYRVLAAKGGPAGENAEYEMGRVLRDGLGEPQRAISTWRAYRAHHPRGLLRIEADISVIETLLDTNDKSGALAEAYDFVHRYPDGERHAEMARLVGDLSRERGEWRAAVEAYDDVLSDNRARPRFRDEVSFHRATCLLASDPRTGSQALRAYLKAFPTGQFQAQAEHLVSETSSPPQSARP